MTDLLTGHDKQLLSHLRKMLDTLAEAQVYASAYAAALTTDHLSAIDAGDFAVRNFRKAKDKNYE